MVDESDGGNDGSYSSLSSVAATTERGMRKPREKASSDAYSLDFEPVEHPNALGPTGDELDGDTATSASALVASCEARLAAVISADGPVEDVLRSRRELAMARIDAGELDGARQLLLANIRDAEDKLSGDDIGAAEAHGDLAYAYLRAGDARAAAKSLSRAIEESDRGSGRQALASSFLRRQLAVLEFWSGDPKDQGMEQLQMESHITAKRDGENSSQARQDRARVETVKRLQPALLGVAKTPRAVQARDAARRELAHEMTSWLPTARWLGGLVQSTRDRLVVARVSAELDDADTPDRLGIDLDARALAALVASRAMKPPLAIGVYGAWGSGKTFLMRRIQWWIEEFGKQAGADTDSPFQLGIAHVRFSAWHYADANLWASLLGEIFQTLSRSPSQRDQQIAAAIEQVNGAKRIRADAARRLRAATNVATRARENADTARGEYDDAIAKAAELKTKDLFTAVELDGDDVKNLNDMAREIGLDTAAKSTRDLLARANEMADIATRARGLATAGPKWRSPLTLSIAAFVIVTGLGLLTAGMSGWSDWKSPSAALVAQFTAVFSAAAAWLGRQSNLARKLLAPAEAIQRQVTARVEKVRAEYEQEILKAEGRAAAAALEVTAFTEQVAAAEVEVGTAVLERDNLTGPILLQRYLAERAGSGDYERHQGFVALAHRDLKNLSDYLTGAQGDPAGRPELSRIVLYIDDLDRCGPQTVADVLAAVHLLLALPLFTVIVGVDPGWLERSLHQTHLDLFGRADHAVDPSDYLEKIFQLTYNLPPLTEESCHNLLTGALTDAFTPAASRLDVAPVPELDLSDRESPKGISGSTEIEAEISAAGAVDRAVDALALSDEEANSIGEVAALVSHTPRRAKRFLSTYLVVRARAHADPRIHLGANDDDSRGLLVLVALMIGTPSAVPFLTGNHSPGDQSVAEWIAELPPSESGITAEDSSRLQQFARNATTLRDVPASATIQWRPIAMRYLARMTLGAPAEH